MRLIDADALTETIANNVYIVVDYFNSKDFGMFWTGGIEKAINEAPTIEAEPVRRGRWELIDDIEPTAYSCSICNKVSACEWGYCPYCGAKMEEQEGD